MGERTESELLSELAAVRPKGRYAPTALPTLFDYERAGVCGPLHPADFAQTIAASVMRMLAPHEMRQVGSVAKIIRDTLERELGAAQRAVKRWVDDEVRDREGR